MSAIREPLPKPGPFPPQVSMVPPPSTVAEAIASLHHSSFRMMGAAEKLLELAEQREETPQLRTIVINPGNNGQYQTLDQCGWAAKSIGILNPGSTPVFVGIGGVSATPSARAPSCPGNSTLVLPVEASDLSFGCDPAVLLAQTAVIYVFRYVTLQPLVLRQVP